MQKNKRKKMKTKEKSCLQTQRFSFPVDQECENVPTPVIFSFLAVRSGIHLNFRQGHLSDFQLGYTPSMFHCDCLSGYDEAPATKVVKFKDKPLIDASDIPDLKCLEILNATRKDTQSLQRWLNGDTLDK